MTDAAVRTDAEIGDLSPAGHTRPVGARQRTFALAGKRAFDIAAGVVLLLVTLPVCAAIAAVLTVQTRGRPFFIHHRIGIRGERIWFPKFRTLARSTAPYADKTKVDLQPISRFASWLRKRHLDELPQLLLVAIGRLSLVGPRPRMANEIEAYRWPEFDNARLRLQQGCTGLWQIGRHHAAPVSANPEYDLFYMHKASFRMDVWIVWRTIVQAFGASPITITDIPRWTHGPGFLPTGATSGIETANTGVLEPAGD